jgi:hypothetical protein
VGVKWSCNLSTCEKSYLDSIHCFQHYLLRVACISNGMENTTIHNRVCILIECIALNVLAHLQESHHQAIRYIKNWIRCYTYTIHHCTLLPDVDCCVREPKTCSTINSVNTVYEDCCD